MIYLDHGATSFPKPPCVEQAVLRALRTCANPGRGGHEAAMEGARVVFSARQTAAELFDCQPEQVVFTNSCTHGLNIAIRSVLKPGDRVLISGFEHNAVLRPLHALGAQIFIAGRQLFRREDTLAEFERALRRGVDAAVFTQVSNVFGYILPIEQMARLCRQYGVPFIVDAAQGAGMLPLHLGDLGARFVAMPGHKGLLGPQGTGILLCAGDVTPLLYGGTGSASRSREMPAFLPDRGEAGTLNVPGIAGLDAGMRCLKGRNMERLFAAEQAQAQYCAQGLQDMGLRVFCGKDQGGTLSFLPGGDCEEAARFLAERNIAVRAGLHCAPLAHESAGTLETGTVRVSFGCDAAVYQSNALLKAMADYKPGIM